MLLITIQIVLWSGSAWWLLRHTQLKSWIKYVYAISVLPLLEVLILWNIKITDMVAPELLDLVTGLEAANWSGKIVAPVAFLAAAPLAIIAFLAWIKALEFIDKKVI